ncbi:MAG: AbrB/MazE/SpoVT family DNA-binding domain-containing protein [Gemmatimonadaceae bacterium]
MDVVTISATFQVVIPPEIRERLKLAPGQKMQALAYQNRIEFIALRPATSSRPASSTCTST